MSSYTTTSTNTMTASKDCPICLTSNKRLILNVRPRPKLTIKLSPRKKNFPANNFDTSLAGPLASSKSTTTIKLSPRKEQVILKLRLRKAKRVHVKHEVTTERKKLTIKLSPRKKVEEVRVKQEA